MTGGHFSPPPLPANVAKTVARRRINHTPQGNNAVNTRPKIILAERLAAKTKRSGKLVSLVAGKQGCYMQHKKPVYMGTGIRNLESTVIGPHIRC